jgi:Ca-activated chloride channel family protein
LSVTVTDSRQRYVTGLSGADFSVYEDGMVQELDFFAAEPVPLDLAILLDTSASMSSNMAVVQEAAVGFARTLRAGDRGTVVAFNDTVQVLQPLTGDLEHLEAAIRRTAAGGMTALYTGVYVALKELGRQSLKTGEVRRQAIVVLSDGEDTGSLVTSDDVLELVRRSGIAIYTISFRSGAVALQGHTSSWFVSRSDYLIRTLAQETGGRAFFPVDIRELAPVYSVIAEELGNQYTLGYVSKNPKLDGAFRRIAVRLPSQPGARPRSRLGYLAPRGSRPADRLQ